MAGLASMNGHRPLVGQQAASGVVLHTEQRISGGCLIAELQIHYHRTYKSDEPINFVKMKHSEDANLQAATPYSSAPFPRENCVKSPCKS
jgi:hypothetical protein